MWFLGVYPGEFRNENFGTYWQESWQNLHILDKVNNIIHSKY